MTAERFAVGDRVAWECPGTCLRLSTRIEGDVTEVDDRGRVRLIRDANGGVFDVTIAPDSLRRVAVDLEDE